jgi:hypothetical protein
MNINKRKLINSIAISCLTLFALPTYAEESKITEEDIDKAIERLNSRIESFPNEEPDYPRFTRFALDYSVLNGNVNDQRQSDFFGGPFADGSNDSNILRLSTNIQLSENFSGGLSVGMINGDSSIDQGTPANIVSSESDGTSYGASLRYQINDWLAAGAFAGWSNGDGSSDDTSIPASSGTFKFTGQTQGAYLAATKVITDRWIYSISPSFTHSKSKSKYFNDAQPTLETISNYELNMWHVDQNISYYFDSYRARLTGGYTYHNVAHETETNSAPRSNSSTMYLGGSYLVSVSHGVELYGVAAKEFGDDVYDEASSVTVGIAKNF